MDLANENRPPPRPGHTRARSAVLKSILQGTRTPSPEKRPNDLDARNVNTGSPKKRSRTIENVAIPEFLKFTANKAPLGEIQQNRNAASNSPKKSSKSIRDEPSSPIRRFRLFDDPSRHGFGYNDTLKQAKEKENSTPPGSSNGTDNAPIWAQFTSQKVEIGQNAPTVRSQTAEVSSQTSTTSTRDFALDGVERRNESNGTRRPISYHSGNSTQRPASKGSNSSASTNGSSKVAAAVAMFNERAGSAPKSPQKSAKTIDEAFEAVLESRNIPENMRHNMRTLDNNIKAEFVKNEVTETPRRGRSPEKQSIWSTIRSKTPTAGRGRSRSRPRDAQQSDADDLDTLSKHSRSRSRAFLRSKDDESPNKRARSNSRPRSLMSLKNFSSSSVHTVGLDGAKESKQQPKVVGPTDPEDFAQYLQSTRKIQDVEVGKLQKLRLLLRSESVAWIDDFVSQGGMGELLALLKRVMQIEWREEHDDLVLHETLRCLKGLCTTQLGSEKLLEVKDDLFPALLKMVFDEERKGPSEFATREIVFHIIFNHLSSAPYDRIESRAKSVLGCLTDPQPEGEQSPLEFISQMKKRRPHLLWCKELSSVTKEVFWIFLHNMNVIPIINVEDEDGTQSFSKRHFPKERPPIASAPYVGGVEWEATNYIATHLDLINGLVASMITKESRNQVRQELCDSGFEKVMGASLRTCKEKFYPGVHEGLKTWIAAALEDDWPIDDVRYGPQQEESVSPKKKSPSKNNSKVDQPPPKIDLPKLEALPTKDSPSDFWMN